MSSNKCKTFIADVLTVLMLLHNPFHIVPVLTYILLKAITSVMLSIYTKYTSNHKGRNPTNRSNYLSVVPVFQYLHGIPFVYL